MLRVALLLTLAAAVPAAADEDAGTPPEPVDAGAPVDADATIEGAQVLALSGTDRLTGSANDAVDPDTGDASDWWRLDVAEPGKLTLTLKLADRSSRVRAELVRAPGEAGVPIRRAISEDVAEAKSVWVRVFVPENADGGAYTLTAEHVPSKAIVAAVVEVAPAGGACSVMASRGSNAGVRPGMRVEVVRQAQPIASGIVESAFPALSRIRLAAGACTVKPGDEVRITPVGR